jgi:hypothetical protein
MWIMASKIQDLQCSVKICLPLDHTPVLLWTHAESKQLQFLDGFWTSLCLDQTLCCIAVPHSDQYLDHTQGPVKAMNCLFLYLHLIKTQIKNSYFNLTIQCWKWVGIVRVLCIAIIIKEGSYIWMKQQKQHANKCFKIKVTMVIWE